MSNTFELAGLVRATVLPLARELRHHGTDRFTPTQLSVLGTLLYHGPLILSELAAEERLSLPTISKAIMALETERMVKRKIGESDRRMWQVDITSAGRDWIEAEGAKRDAWLAERLGTLSIADRTTIETSLPILRALIRHESL